jgi:hypothetical protein
MFRISSPTLREKQTLPIELFNEKTGWAFNFEKYMSELKRLA